jgi:cellulose synthase/poly-beta-1,6-N-acetylglucosamine synthase-like glycosyltransferase
LKGAKQMTGVEILSEQVIYTSKVWVALIGIFAFIGTLIFFVAFINSKRNVALSINLVCMIVCFITFLTLAIIDGSTNHLKNYGHTEYKVVIDDSVLMNEFLDKYEILGQEGKIYTVKERE